MRRFALAFAALLVLAGCDRFDRSFGGDGTVELVVQSTTAVRSGDGIVVLGTASGRPALVRYDAEGRRDTAFGNDGWATVSGWSGNSVAVAAAANGDFVITDVDTDDGYAIARYRADGEVLAVTKHPGSIVPADVAVGPDGTVVVVNRRSMHVAIVDADGRASIVETQVGEFGALAAAGFQPDGKIVVAGSTTAGSPDGLRDIVLVRYLPDGRVDTSFAWRGASLVDLGGDEEVQDLAVMPDGSIVLSTHSSLQSRTRQWLVRLTTQGVPDPSFDGDGRSRAQIEAHTEGRTLHVRPDGRVVTAGLVLTGDDSDLLTTQWLADGRPDPGWGDVGANRTDLGGWEQLYAGALLDDGRLLAVGGNQLVRYKTP